MTLPKVNRSLAVASALGWIWAIFMALVSIAVAIPAASRSAGEAVQMIAPALLSVASGAAAHGIRRRRWPYLAVGASVGWVAFLAMVRLKISLPGIGLNLAILGLVLTNMRQFR